MSESFARRVSPFNSVLETGLRSLYILTADIEKTFDLQQLLAFDHLVVHTGDFEDAPESLHPANPSRNGELVIRRDIVERGLLLMESKILIKRLIGSDGFSYQAGEFALGLVENLKSPYMVKLRARSNWVVQQYASSGGSLFDEVFNQAFDRWATEFQFEQLSIAGDT